MSHFLFVTYRNCCSTYSDLFADSALSHNQLNCPMLMPITHQLTAALSTTGSGFSRRSVCAHSLRRLGLREGPHSKVAMQTANLRVNGAFSLAWLLQHAWVCCVKAVSISTFLCPSRSQSKLKESLV